MDDIIARPGALKQINLSLIRKAIKNKGTATRAEITRETQISSTTVRSLLIEMQSNGEIEHIGHDDSSGGRKAKRYQLRRDRFYGVAFCFEETKIHYLLIDIFGEIVEKGLLNVSNGDAKEPVSRYLDQLRNEKEIKAIGLGVPGIISGGAYLRKNQENVLTKVDIGDFLAQKYHIPIIMENDINAITIGFGRCYRKEFPGEKQEQTNMAFVYFEKECISAGFISGGKHIRGWNNYAGELGLVPYDNQNSVAESLSKAGDEVQYSAIVAKILCWICAILNPKYIALGGPDFRKECLGPIGDHLFDLLPHDMLAEILYSADVWHDYYEGMAYLTAGRIFDEIMLIKE